MRGDTLIRYVAEPGPDVSMGHPFPAFEYERWSKPDLCVHTMWYGKAFTRRNLKRHQRAQQPLSGFLRCPLCRKVFSWDHRSDLFRHCRQVHQLSAMEAPSFKDISPGFLQDEPPVIPNDLIQQQQWCRCLFTAH